MPIMNIPSSRNPAITVSVSPLIKSPFVGSHPNPLIMSKINPKVTSSLNYKINSLINPMQNARLNPKINTEINPTANANIKGLYVFDLQRKPTGFTAKANEQVDLLFSRHCEFLGTLIGAHIDVRNEFDLANAWVGYWVHARGNMWLRLDLSNHRIGFTT